MTAAVAQTAYSVWEERKDRYRDIIRDCQVTCQCELIANRNPDDMLLYSTRLQFMIRELQGIVRQLESLQDEWW